MVLDSKIDDILWQSGIQYPKTISCEDSKDLEEYTSEQLKDSLTIIIDHGYYSLGYHSLVLKLSTKDKNDPHASTLERKLRAQSLVDESVVVLRQICDNGVRVCGTGWDHVAQICQKVHKTIVGHVKDRALGWSYSCPFCPKDFLNGHTFGYMTLFQILKGIHPVLELTLVKVHAPPNSPTNDNIPLTIDVPVFDPTFSTRCRCGYPFPLVALRSHCLVTPGDVVNLKCQRCQTTATLSLILDPDFFSFKRHELANYFPPPGFPPAKN